MNHIYFRIGMASCVVVTFLITFFLINKRSVPTSGTFTTSDKTGLPIVLEWHKTSVIAPEFSVFMKEMWPLAHQAYVPIEMAFLKKHPEVVETEAYFKPFEPLFKDGLERANWALAEAQMEEILKGHFVFDPTKFSKEMLEKFAQDGSFFVVAKDASTGAVLGFITFLIRASYAPGDVKVMTLAVDTFCHNRGIGKLLMSSLFKIKPDVARIFLCTRITNDSALRAYQSWGFTHDEKPVLDHYFNMNHWSFWEYKAEQIDHLQKIAQTTLKKA